MMYVCLDCKQKAVRPALIEGKWQGVCDKCGSAYEISTYIKLAEKAKAKDVREVVGDGKFDNRNLESK